MADIDDLIKGSIDMHVHFSPDPLFNRRADAFQVAKQAQEFGMKGIVLKSHDYPTAPLAYTVNKLVTDVSVFGGICIEYEIGSMNAFAVEASAKIGAKIVWMPTFSAANSRKAVSQALRIDLKGRGINILEEEVFQKLNDILQIIKEYDMILATGHLSPGEIFALVKEAKKVGISKILITHALSQKGLDKHLNLEEQQRLAQEGAIIEHCLYELMPLGGNRHPREMVEAIKLVGAERCVMSTDFGQEYHPTPSEGMRMFIATLMRSGLSDSEVEYMVKRNPATLLGIGL
jgi:hypothetical protein